MTGIATIDACSGVCFMIPFLEVNALTMSVKNIQIIYSHGGIITKRNKLQKKVREEKRVLAQNNNIS